MDNTWTGAMTDIMHGVWMDFTDDAQRGAMTDIMYDGWMDGWYR